MSQSDRRRILLHIGLQHTGARAIQAMLAHNRERLVGQGVRPVIFDHGGWPLVYMFATPDRRLEGGDPRFRRLWGERRRGARPAAVAAARRELDAALDDPHAHTVILSCELLAEQLRSREVKALARRLQEAGEVSVLGYLREPGAYAQAAAETRLREGVSLRMLKRTPPQPGYRKSLLKFIRHFGQAAVELRPHHPRRLVGGRVLDDFESACGFAPGTLERPTAPLPDTRLSRAAALLLDIRNRLIGWRRPGRAIRFPPMLTRPLAELLPGRAFRLGTETRREARRRSRRDMVWLGEALGRRPFPAGRGPALPPRPRAPGG
ncbi:hypothetical protein [Albimonas pacifica]|uniref:Uncharacterized protein n=1 Tax=Albimonas pacifica TaxID=1114924 RepID=A0A1I3GWV0_9RHOB|nr:hypothetical protein [Albimonas pacifica]SFI27790.1 hypothetical protein SAMN05216258_105375 [Albimonas pacifica]